MRPAHCLSDHAPRPTPFSLSLAFGPAALARLGLVTAFLPVLAQDVAPPTALKTPPTIPPGPASPAHSWDSPPPQRRKITCGEGRLRYPQLHWARRPHPLFPSSPTPDVLLQTFSRHTWSPPIL